MAIYPCQVGSHRYRGAQQTFYPAVMFSGDVQRKKWRLCPQHFTDVVLTAESMLEPIDQAVNEERCGACDKELPTVAAFATYYADHSEREDLYGRLCVAHAEEWLSLH